MTHTAYFKQVSKKRTRRNVKFQRAIQGASLESILQKRNMTTDQKVAQRDQAVRAAKEKAKQKKMEKSKLKDKMAGVWWIQGPQIPQCILKGRQNYIFFVLEI